MLKLKDAAKPNNNYVNHFIIQLMHNVKYVELIKTY